VTFADLYRLGFIVTLYNAGGIQASRDVWRVRSLTASGIVTLMTDFGTVDGYVAAMKGALLSTNARAVLVDVTHHISTQDVTEAAFQLATVWSTFPAGTVHMVVVDPGVGGDRRAIVVEAGGHYFVTPDNGLLTLLVSNVPADRAVVLDRPEFFRADVSSTFHGRDIFAPVAGLLASGQVQPQDLGSEVSTESIVRLPWAPAEDRHGQIRAPVVSVDRFGNCRTLLTRRELPFNLTSVYVRSRDVTVRGIHSTYSDVPMGKTLALFGSHGGLELAVRGGSAAMSWEIARGDDVIVFESEPEMSSS
jgi:S-adenosyl-L-methionine hydrolase (adenosine-forming)